MLRHAGERGLKGVRDKRCLGPLRAIPVACADLNTTDIEVPRHADRDRSLLRIQDVHPRVCDGTTNRHVGEGARLHRVGRAWPPRHIHRRFGRAVEVEQLRGAPCPFSIVRPARDEVRREGFARADHMPQALAPVQRRRSLRREILRAIHKRPKH